MEVQAGAGASYDPTTAIFDDVAASQCAPWPFDMLPKDLLILLVVIMKPFATTASS